MEQDIYSRPCVFELICSDREEAGAEEKREGEEWRDKRARHLVLYPELLVSCAILMKIFRNLWC